MLDEKDIKIVGNTDKPLKGQWHCGPNNSWMTVTHIPTMQSVRVYGRSQHKMRQKALTMLEMLVDDCRADKCLFPEQLET